MFSEGRQDIDPVSSQPYYHITSMDRISYHGDPMEIEEIRKKMAECDETIIELIAERNRLAVEMGKAKKRNSSDICVPAVEEQVKERYVTNCTAKGVSKETAEKVATVLMDESKKVQEKIINGFLK